MQCFQQSSQSISHFRIIQQDSIQGAREAREAIHMGINHPTLNCNTEKMYIPEIFNQLLGADRSTTESNHMVDLP